jgi:hypothetical protein
MRTMQSVMFYGKHNFGYTEPILCKAVLMPPCILPMQQRKQTFTAKAWHAHNHITWAKHQLKA